MLNLTFHAPILGFIFTGPYEPIDWLILLWFIVLFALEVSKEYGFTDRVKAEWDRSEDIDDWREK